MKYYPIKCLHQEVNKFFATLRSLVLKNIDLLQAK